MPVRDFTSAEINALPHKDLNRDIIAAPVDVGTLAFVLSPPYPGFSRIDSFASNQAIPFISPVTNQPRIPWPNLAAMMLNFDAADPNPTDDWLGNIDSWSSYDVMQSFGITPPQCDGDPASYHCFQGISSQAHPAGVLQSEADELNYYMQLAFVEQTKPRNSLPLASASQVFSQNELADPSIKWTPGGDLLEQIPRQPSVSRDGADQAGDQLTLPGWAAGFPLSGNVAGAIGALPPSAKLAALIGANASAPPLSFVAVQNACNTWVQPSPATIDNAIDVSSQPLYALTHSDSSCGSASDPLSNAYPLTWVDNLYVKAQGLTAAKTEAVATLIRYLATDGQNAAAPWGEGTLSKPLVAQALNAANQVVQSDCPAAGGQVVSNSTPGADAPNLSGIDAIGTMLHCVAPPSQATAAGASGSSPLGSFSLPGIPSTPTAPAPTSTPAATAAVQLPDSLSVAKLPLPLPGTPIDRVVTVLVGALLYLAFRDPLRRLLGRAVE